MLLPMYYRDVLDLELLCRLLTLPELSHFIRPQTMSGVPTQPLSSPGRSSNGQQ